MEEEKQIKESNKGLKILLVISILIIIGLTGYIVYDKVINKEEKEITTEKKEKQITTKKDNKLSTNESIIQMLSKVIGISDSYLDECDTSQNIVNYFGKNPSVDIKSLSNSWKLSFIYKLKEYKGYKLEEQLSEDNSPIIYYNEEPIKNIYKTLFGDGYSPVKFPILYDIEMEYDSSKQKYYYNSGFGNMCGPTSYAYSKFDYAEEEGNTINLYANYFVAISDNANNKYKIYSDYDQNNLITTLPMDFSISKEQRDLKIIKDYSSKLGKYKYTFIKNAEGNYIFTSVNKIN